MKVLYIHGLDSKPNPTKLKIIESFGCKVLAQHINYRSTPNAFALLDKYIVDNKIEFIIGSSLGGRLGYWLSEYEGLPCLLFNPAIISNTSVNLEIPGIITGQCPFRLIVFGEKDTVIDPVKNEDFFTGNSHKQQTQKFLKLAWLEHQVDEVTFEICMHWAMDCLGSWKMDGQDSAWL